MFCVSPVASLRTIRSTPSCLASRSALSRLMAITLAPAGNVKLEAFSTLNFSPDARLSSSTAFVTGFLALRSLSASFFGRLTT